MAIRIRKIDGVVVACCAAKTLPEDDDLYLDDNAHHAVYEKIAADMVSEGFVKCEYGVDQRLKNLRLRLEIEDNGHPKENT